jgi:hypothetical protein
MRPWGSAGAASAEYGADARSSRCSCSRAAAPTPPPPGVGWGVKRAQMPGAGCGHQLGGLDADHVAKRYVHQNQSNPTSQ